MMAEQQANYADQSSNNFPNDYNPDEVDYRVALRANAIRGKVYGRDVRGALAQGIEIASVDAKQAKTNAAKAQTAAQDMQDRWNTQINGKVEPKEVIDARKPMGGEAYPTLNARLDAGVDERSKNVKAFGVVGDGVADDTTAIKAMIARAVSGDSFFFPKGSYKVTDNIQINKRLNLQGIKPTYQSGDLTNGTVIRGGGGLFFVDGSSGSSVSGIGIVVAKGFTNGFDVRGTLNGIVIRDCLTIAQAHGYLIESYLGIVSDVLVENCEAHDSIHGFISKATRTTFSSCLVQSVPFWGFGVISDNIPGKNNIGAAIDNKVVNCRAIGAGVAFSQYRRNYFEDNADAVPCNGNQFVGCSNTDCGNGLVIGDSVGDNGGGKYTTYVVTNTTVSNYTEAGGKLRANYSVNLVLSGTTLQSPAEIQQDSTHSNQGMSASARSGQKLGEYNDLRILGSSATPDISFGHTFRSNNTVPTTITSLIGGNAGDSYTIVLWDNFTTISPTHDLYLIGGVFSGYGNSITLRYQSGIYFEVSRTHYQVKGLQYPGTASTIDPGLSPFIDVVINESMKPAQIHIQSPELRDVFLTIFIRSSNGTGKQGGFDPTQFVVPTDLPATDLNFGNGLMTKWVYLSAIKKYILVNWRMTKYA